MKIYIIKTTEFSVPRVIKQVMVELQAFQSKQTALDTMHDIAETILKEDSEYRIGDDWEDTIDIECPLQYDDGYATKYRIELDSVLL